jgi:sortase B
MLGELDKYESKSYYDDNNRYIGLLTERGTENYEIAIVYKTAVGTGSKSEFRYCDTADFESANEFAEYIRSTMHRQLYDTGVVPKYGDKLLSLSTCEYSRKNGRLVVLAKRID